MKYKEGVTINFEIVSGVDENINNLQFTVSGNYLAITNFITELENDSTLQFTIDEFSMTQNQCTFVVRDVYIKKETTTSTNNITNKTSQTSNTASSSNNTTATNTVANNNTVQ